MGAYQHGGSAFPKLNKKLLELLYGVRIKTDHGFVKNHNGRLMHKGTAD